jgi:hypothetical protein
MPEKAGATLQTAQGIEARLKAAVVPRIMSQIVQKPGDRQGQPEPAPTVASPTPAPSSGASVPAPEAIPAPPAPPPVQVSDPRIDDLLAKVEAQNAELRALRDRKVEFPKLNLPSKEQLDAMPQGEALSLLAQTLDGHMRAAVESVDRQIGAFATERLAPLQDNLNAVRKREAEGLLKGKFPRLDLEKYRPKFEEALRKHRTLDFESAIRLVADPADLMPADSPTTPVSAPGVHVETGLPARTASTPAPAPKVLSVGELMAQSREARQKGDPFLANKLQEQAIKVKVGL